MSAIGRLAELLGVGERDVERALKDEQRARSAISRRALLLGSAAVAVQAVMPVAPTLDLEVGERIYSFVWNNPLAAETRLASIAWMSPMLVGAMAPYLMSLKFKATP